MLEKFKNEIQELVRPVKSQWLRKAIARVTHLHAWERVRAQQSFGHTGVALRTTLIRARTAFSCAWGLLEACWRMEEGSRRLGVARVDRIRLPRLPPPPEAFGGVGCRV